ncbi:PqiC family protein [Desulfolithobacter sp.]
MKSLRSLLLPILGLLLLLGQGGCITRAVPVHQYTLVPLAREPLASARELSGLLLVGPVHMPPYINGPGIVTRTGDSGINRSSRHFWAGPPATMIRDTLVADLSRLLGSSLVAPWPGPRFGNPVLQVEITLLSFAGQPGGAFTCEAIWSLGNIKKRHLLQCRTFQAVLAMEDPSYDTYVQTGSQALHKLAREIAVAILDAGSSTVDR